MKKFTSFALLAVVALLAFASCSKTRDGLGLDTIDNNARTGKWEVTHQIYLGSATEPATSENLTEGAGYAEFKSDGKVYYYNESGVKDAGTSYSFSDTKSMNYDGDKYAIQENLAGSFSKMTIQRETTTGREVYIFQR
ncbi:hypothetical protein [Niabella ginsengisoli]|uniref:Lipocalin-like domain-containing protein n=1 Tax=Niabella ginsengisoli TaxID=522298 RepID=A0ABS9SE17_9BACT|nr:hypothetical protein [Niabella ginsengisoli]MCH5596597.1 hypothetical protein [Niabella ginsengisoli]